ncbi:glycerol kinase GlpK [Verrucomicrobiales bacterium BCK34]|nr:glycerol kinase GlpK [Verrucomicrobiales bacterium BCK34]
MAKYILALDQGTTSSRAIVFNDDGDPVAKSQKEFEQIFPKPGLVEHNANTIWKTQLEVARAAIAEAGLKGSDIAGIGITNQRETVVLWDRNTGEPIHNAIVWQDRRTAEACLALKEAGHADHIQEITGLVIDAYFSGTKLRWLLDNVPGARERAEKGELAFGTIDSWLVWNLTGGALHITDATNASRTMLCDIDKIEWSDEMLDLLDIPRSVLPEIRDCSEIYGSTAPGIFDSEIPIAGIAGDQHAALFGQACHEKGMAKNTYGTGCFLLLNTGTKRVKSENKLLTTIAWRIDGKTEYALEGSIFIGGAVVQWLRDQLGIIQSSEEIEALAREVEDNGGVYFVPAFAGLGAPHWDPFARGVISGLTRGSNKAHIARAALEGIVYQSYDVLEAMKHDSGIELSEMRVDGGASMNDLLMEMQAELLQVPVLRCKVAETTALGAAFLAGIAVGVWKDKAEIAAKWAADGAYKPSPESSALRDRLPEWQRAVEQAKS